MNVRNDEAFVPIYVVHVHNTTTYMNVRIKYNIVYLKCNKFIVFLIHLSILCIICKISTISAVYPTDKKEHIFLDKLVRLFTTSFCQEIDVR